MTVPATGTTPTTRSIKANLIAGISLAAGTPSLLPNTKAYPVSSSPATSPATGIVDSAASAPTPCLVKGIRTKESIVLANLAKLRSISMA